MKLDIVSGIAMVVVLWVMVGIAWIMAKVERWVNPIIIMVIIITIIGFLFGSFVRK